MRKILLCDDDGDIVALMQIIIKSMDIDFASVSKIKDIEALVVKEKPDLILMDLWIPDIGGEKAVEILKKNNKTKEIPVLLFSATDRLNEICDEIGADGCIHKPFDVAQFKNQIANYF